MNLARNIFNRVFSYKGIQLRSNIIGSASRGLVGVNPNQLAITGVSNRGATTQMNGSKLMSEYYRVMDELQDYELTELTTLVTTAFKDFITSYFSKEEELVSFTEGRKDPILSQVNKDLSDLSIRDDIKSHLNGILYWGSHCNLLTWDSENREFRKKPLLFDHTVVTVFKDQEIEKHLILDKEYNICEVSATSLIRYGSRNLSLINNIREEEGEDKKASKVITKKYEYLTSMPLYYEIVPKVKEFILNDQIISLLNIKDLVQPLLLLINCDKNTDTTMANSLATNIENLINKYVDISTIFSARFSINDLMDSIINNIRVLPDYNGAAANLGTVDLSKLKEKIDSLRGDQDNRKEAIVNALSLTMDFLQGRITKWDALKQSERLNSRINSIVESLNDSVKELACTLYYLRTGKKLRKELIKSNLFTKTATQFTSELSNSEVVSQLNNSVTSIIESAQNTIKQNELIDPTRYYKYVKNKLALIDPEAYDLLTEERFMKLLNLINKEKEDGY